MTSRRRARRTRRAAAFRSMICQPVVRLRSGATPLAGSTPATRSAGGECSGVQGPTVVCDYCPAHAFALFPFLLARPSLAPAASSILPSYLSLSTTGHSESPMASAPTVLTQSRSPSRRSRQSTNTTRCTSSRGQTTTRFRRPRPGRRRPRTTPKGTGGLVPRAVPRYRPIRQL